MIKTKTRSLPCVLALVVPETRKLVHLFLTHHLLVLLITRLLDPCCLIGLLV